MSRAKRAAVISSSDDEDEDIQEAPFDLKRLREDILGDIKRMKQRIESVFDMLQADEDFVVPDEDEEADENSQWISDDDAQKTVELFEMLQNRQASFTDLLHMKSMVFQGWWKRHFQDRLDIIERGFGHDDGSRAQLICRYIRDAILKEEHVALKYDPSKDRAEKCATCGMSRCLHYLLTIRRTKYRIGKSCAGVVESLIDFWKCVDEQVIPEENALEAGRDAFAQMLGCMQAIEQAHENKGKNM